MDLSAWAPQLATFAAGAVTGGLVVYWTLTWRDRRKAHPMTGPARDRSKLAVFIIGLSAILMVFGLQVRADNKDDAKDQARDRCLNAYAVSVGVYLTDTLNTRVGANAELDKAQKQLTRAGGVLAEANTNVVLAVAGLFDVPPTTDRADLVAALERFRVAAENLDAASKAYAEVEAKTKDTLDMTGTPSKPYDPPKVDCAQ